VASTGWGDGTPPSSNNVFMRLWANLRAFLRTTRGKVVAGVGLAVLIVASAVVVQATSSESTAPETTTTTASTTTTAPPTTPPPPPPPTWPLTGAPISDPALANKPALIVKIDNVEPDSRPQAGINQADIVYEERVEGAVTRLMAVFHSTDAAPVGPVRSARTSDIGLFKAFGTPLFAWSGSNAIFVPRIRNAGIVDVGYDAATSQYYRARDRRAPHNLMLHGTPDMWAAGYGGGTAPGPVFAYRAQGEPATGGTPVGGVHIVFATGAGSAPVDWTWTGAGWARNQAGTPHLDANGTQVGPENVIVSFTPYANTDVNDQFGVPIREAQTVGEGDAWVLTGGMLINAHWVKPALEAPTQYLGADGQPIRLTPGRTWVELPEPGTATTF
jgi:hypothetical protein